MGEQVKRSKPDALTGVSEDLLDGYAGQLRSGQRGQAALETTDGRTLGSDNHHLAASQRCHAARTDPLGEAMKRRA